jgi:hypothetical protein
MFPCQCLSIAAPPGNHPTDAWTTRSLSLSYSLYLYLFLSLSFSMTWKKHAGCMSDAVSVLIAKRKHFHAPKLMTKLRSKEAIYHATLEEPNADTVSKINIHNEQVTMKMVTFCLIYLKIITYLTRIMKFC